MDENGKISEIKELNCQIALSGDIKQYFSDEGKI